MILSILGTLRFLANQRWEEVIPLAVCMLFLMVLFWYLTVRICLDLTERVWRRKFSAERTRREAAEKANQAIAAGRKLEPEIVADFKSHGIQLRGN